MVALSVHENKLLALNQHVHIRNGHTLATKYMIYVKLLAFVIRSSIVSALCSLNISRET